jgi:hypothetical protein
VLFFLPYPSSRQIHRQVRRSSSRPLGLNCLITEYALLMVTIPSIFSEVPANLPSPDQIVALCKEAGYEGDRIAFADPSSSSGAVLAWFKYGPNVTVDEARTQVWVAEHLNINFPEASVRVPSVYMAFTSPHPFWPIGYIIMEYIDAPDCRNRDYER